MIQQDETHFSQALNTVGRSWSPPWAINGSMTHYRFAEPGRPPKMFGGGMSLPINVMVVARHGHAYRCLVHQDRVEVMH